MKRLGWICAPCAALALVAPASAHHSFAMFNRNTEMVLEGEVKEFQWTNPHIWTQLLVEGEDGSVTEWSIEGGSPNGLRRQGWTRTSLQPGERVTMTVNPLVNGRPGGSFVRAVKADGSVLGRDLPPPDQDVGD